MKEISALSADFGSNGRPLKSWAHGLGHCWRWIAAVSKISDYLYTSFFTTTLINSCRIILTGNYFWKVRRETDKNFRPSRNMYVRGKELLFSGKLKSYFSCSFLQIFLKHLFFSSTHNDTQCALSHDTSTSMYIISLKSHTMAGFEPGIFFSVGGRDGHYATPPGYFSCKLGRKK
jgi:hypothetical protein